METGRDGECANFKDYGTIGGIMAVTFTLSNHYRYQLMHKQIDFVTDVFKAIQMTGEFVFNEDIRKPIPIVS